MLPLQSKAVAITAGETPPLLKTILSHSQFDDLCVTDFVPDRTYSWKEGEPSQGEASLVYASTRVLEKTNPRDLTMMKQIPLYQPLDNLVAKPLLDKYRLAVNTTELRRARALPADMAADPAAGNVTRTGPNTIIHRYFCVFDGEQSSRSQKAANGSQQGAPSILLEPEESSLCSNCMAK
ncbi:hypothetical protein BT63DRAFT_451635 [Microthyrium microscopicum]|uniref:Uncharacterized protein n=1 Tax=Microthyrium microscopicum TaxID=703497 RepID=A0A6A6UQ77_9PEZI|nr:hypothetical protein BT63DRAFT_451635 [Microthyrium microscopicum]